MAEQQERIAITEAAPAEAQAPPAAERARRALQRLRADVDRLLEDFSLQSGRFPFKTSMFDFEPLHRVEAAIGRPIPDADILEREDDFLVSVELPGLGAEDVDVALADGLLTIRAEKRDPGAADRAAIGHCLSERRYGTIRRSFRLPATVEREGLAAHLERGVLLIRLPKTEAARTPVSRIPVGD